MNLNVLNVWTSDFFTQQKSGMPFLKNQIFRIKNVGYCLHFINSIFLSTCHVLSIMLCAQAIVVD